MEKNTNKGLIVLTIILSILVVGLSIYLVYDKVLNDDNTINGENDVVDNDNTNAENSNNEGISVVKELSYSSLDSGDKYTIILNSNGEVSVNSTNNISVNLNIDNVRDIILFNDEPGYLPGQYCYMLTTNGEVYSYVISNVLDNNNKVEKINNIDNVTQFALESYAPEGEGVATGGCRKLLAITSDGSAIKLNNACS